MLPLFLKASSPPWHPGTLGEMGMGAIWTLCWILTFCTFCHSRSATCFRPFFQVHSWLGDFQSVLRLSVPESSSSSIPDPSHPQGPTIMLVGVDPQLWTRFGSFLMGLLCSLIKQSLWLLSYSVASKYSVAIEETLTRMHNRCQVGVGINSAQPQYYWQIGRFVSCSLCSAHVRCFMSWLLSTSPGPSLSILLELPANLNYLHFSNRSCTLPSFIHPSRIIFEHLLCSELKRQNVTDTCCGSRMEELTFQERGTEINHYISKNLPGSDGYYEENKAHFLVSSLHWGPGKASVRKWHLIWNRKDFSSPGAPLEPG